MRLGNFDNLDNSTNAATAPADSVETRSAVDVTPTGKAVPINELRDFVAAEFGFQKGFSKLLITTILDKIAYEVLCKGNSIRLGPYLGTLNPVVKEAHAKTLPNGETVTVDKRIKVVLSNRPMEPSDVVMPVIEMKII